MKKMFFALYLSLFNAYASPPQFIYRYDTRPPLDVFNHGFFARGNSDGVDDPLAHMVGSNEALQNSRLISALESPEGYANRFTGMLVSNNISEGYLYRIRATDNVYSMFDYLNNLRQIGFMTNDERVPLANSLLNRARIDREWFAVDHIEAFEVAGAQRIRVNLNTGDVTVEPEEQNPFFTPADTHASDFPYPLLANPAPHMLSFMHTPNGPTPQGNLMGPPSPPSRGVLSSLFSCFGTGSSYTGKTEFDSNRYCHANISMSLGQYYGITENINDTI